MPTPNKLPATPDPNLQNAWDAYIFDDDNGINTFSDTPTLVPAEGQFLDPANYSLDFIPTATDANGQTAPYNPQVVLNGTPTLSSVPVNVTVTSNNNPPTPLPTLTIKIVLQYTPHHYSIDPVDA